jgi:HCOMODA/2-hydroxy-3-carboxy-muconic semialdehyde decarboxylase
MSNKSGGPVAASIIADLAAASRILAANGVVDAFGHVSLRHPKQPDRYLMARSVAPALVNPEDIIEYDLDSNAINADGRSSFNERFIHGEIYKARPDVQSVAHSHSPSVIPFGLVRVPLQAMFHTAAFLAAGAPIFDIREKFGATDMLVSDPPKGVALASTLGNMDIVLMRGHGSVACGPTLERTVFRAVYTEVNARVQHWTMALGALGALGASGKGTPIAALDTEEGRLADAINERGCMRAWELWRAQVRSQVNW